MQERENPLEEIMRIWGQSEEALLKKKTTYQRVNGTIVATITEDLREGQDGEIEIIKEEDRLLDDNGYPIGRSGAAQAECGCWISLRRDISSSCPVCERPMCLRHSGFWPEVGMVCPSCYTMIRSQMRKGVIKDFFFRRKKSE